MKSPTDRSDLTTAMDAAAARAMADMRRVEAQLEQSDADVRAWLDVPASPPRRKVLAAVRAAYPDVCAMADAISIVAPRLSAREAFKYGVMLSRAIEAGPVVCGGSRHVTA